MARQIYWETEIGHKLHIIFQPQCVSPCAQKTFPPLGVSYFFESSRLNSLRPRDAYTDLCVSKLIIIVQIMACRLVGVKPYLNRWWDIVNCTLRNKFQWNFNRNPYIFIQENAFENVVCEMAAILSRPQCAGPIYLQDPKCGHYHPW